MSAVRENGELVISPPRGLPSLELGEIWAYRELFATMVWRDVSVRYKQSLLGVLWALLAPLLALAIFSLIFGRLAKLPSDGLPYPVFCYAGLLPWLFFSQSLSRATASMVAERNLLTKVYFPRLIVLLAATLAPLVDLLVASSLLAVLIAWYGIVPTVHALYLVPLCVAWAWLTAVGVGSWLAALNVHYRDVGQAIPFLVQVWMYASPVVYPASLLPDSWQWLYALNPMAGVIEGLRFALLGHGQPPGPALLVSLAMSLLLFVTGLLYFKRMEHTFADVV